jgi:hypothetical protein
MRVLAFVDHANDPVPPVDAARELARGLGASLTLLAAAPPDANAAAVAAAQGRLDRLADASVDTMLSRSAAPAAVADTADAGGYDLVVVPWSINGAPGHLLHDQIVHELLHGARVRVLLVPIAHG